MGVLAQMQHAGIHPSSKSIATLSKPDSIRSSLLRALQLENEDQLEMACATYEHVMSVAPSNTKAWTLHAGLFRCQLPDPTSLPALVTRADALLATQPPDNPEEAAWARQLNEIRVEAVIRLGDWEKLDRVMASVGGLHIEPMDNPQISFYSDNLVIYVIEATQMETKVVLL